MRVAIIILPALVLAQLPAQPLAPWGSNQDPTDVPKRHVEQVAADRHTYTVRQGGTMDGTNCRAPLGPSGTGPSGTSRVICGVPCAVRARDSQRPPRMGSPLRHWRARR
jgi:hypothetical protein